MPKDAASYSAKAGELAESPRMASVLTDIGEDLTRLADHYDTFFDVAEEDKRKK